MDLVLNWNKPVNNAVLFLGNKKRSIFIKYSEPFNSASDKVKQSLMLYNGCKVQFAPLLKQSQPG